MDNKQDFKVIADKYRMQLQEIEDPEDKFSKCIEVSNKCTIGMTEMQILLDLLKCTKELIEKEDELLVSDMRQFNPKFKLVDDEDEDKKEEEARNNGRKDAEYEEMYGSESSSW